MERTVSTELLLLAFSGIPDVSPREMIEENRSGVYGLYADLVAEQKVDCIICTGELSECMYKGAKAHATVSQVVYCKDRENLLNEIESYMKTGDTVLVKASHGMHFEEVVKRLS